jgi:hypothetical protein
MANLQTVRDLINGLWFEVTLTSKAYKKIFKNIREQPATLDYDITFTFDKTKNTTNILKHYFKEGEFDWYEKKEIFWDSADENEIEEWCTILEHVKRTSAVQQF